jgi:ketosteroid isomerase-like protein
MSAITKAAPIALAGLLSAATIALAGASDKPASEAQEERNKAAVTAAFDHWTAGGSGFFDTMLSPDVVWTIEGSTPSAGKYTGRQDFVERAVRPFASRLSTPVRPVAKKVWADGDHVIIHWQGEGMARDGVLYRNSYSWIFRLQDGKAVEVTAFLDLAPYEDVLRRVPDPAAGGERR